MGTFASVEGQRFSRLLVIERDEDFVSPRGKRAAIWKCLCDCGKTAKVSTNSLRSGNTKSCGCYKTEQSRARTTGSANHSYRHGLSSHPSYNSWLAARHRVLGIKKNSAKNYIDRGITMCDRWLNSFENFVEDMGEKPPGMTLERKNNDLGYTPENCCWATMTEQARNKRGLLVITIGGVTKIATDWSEETGVKACTILDRIRRGWRPKDAVLTPVGDRPRRSIRERKANSLGYGE